jgi:hypothetical protein
MGRSFGAIVAGFAVAFLLTIAGYEMLRLLWPSAFGIANRIESAPALLLVLLYTFVFAALGCSVTARLAPNAPMVHALVLGGIILVLDTIATVSRWGSEPPWYHVAVVALVLPSAWVGGQWAEAARIRRP